MRKFCAILFAMFIVSSGFGETIKIGFFDLKPYVIKQADGKFTGAAVEYFEQYIAPKMGLTVEWVGPLTIPRAYQDLETGEIDASLITVKNPEREQKYLFPSNYYMKMKPSIVVLKDSPLKLVNKQEDLFDLKIAFQADAAYNPFIKNDKIKLDLTVGIDYKKNNFNKLKLKRIDGIYDNNEVSNPYDAKQYGMIDQIRVIILPVNPTFIYTAFAKTEKGQKLVKAYDSINDTLYQTETIDKIIAKYK